MGAILPLPHIIFFLATLLLPPGTKSFTVPFESPSPMEVTWTRQADGGWQAKTKEGQDGGVWSVKDLTVLETREGRPTTRTDLSEFVKIDDRDAGEKKVSVEGQPVTAATSGSTLTLSQAGGGALKKPVVISFVEEGNGKAIKSAEKDAASDDDAPPAKQKNDSAEEAKPAPSPGLAQGQGLP